MPTVEVRAFIKKEWYSVGLGICGNTVMKLKYIELLNSGQSSFPVKRLPCPSEAISPKSSGVINSKLSKKL